MCLALGWLLASSLRAQTLWPGTTAGMTVEEVQRAFPDARAPETPPEPSAVRGEELLELKQAAIAGHTFRVGFFFKAERLTMVALAETGEVPMKEFEKFRALLRAKYGLEYSTTSSEFLELTWRIAQTVIHLTWEPMGRGISTLSLTYEAPVPREPDRL